MTLTLETRFFSTLTLDFSTRGLNKTTEIPAKSTFLFYSYAENDTDYFIEAAVNPDDKDSWLRLISRMVWEAAELGAITRRSDREALKNFISARMVTVRKPYGQYDIIKPALASLVGTINNEAGFLTDPTGNRRFLTCRLTRIDWQGYTTNCDPDQIWAEAVALYRQGESGQLDPVEARLQQVINAGYMVELPLEMLLLKHFEIKPEIDIWTPAIDIVKRLEELGLRDGHQRQHLRDLSAVMQQLGVPKSRRRLGDGQRPAAYKGVFERIVSKSEVNSRK